MKVRTRSRRLLRFSCIVVSFPAPTNILADIDLRTRSGNKAAHCGGCARVHILPGNKEEFRSARVCFQGFACIGQPVSIPRDRNHPRSQDVNHLGRSRIGKSRILSETLLCLLDNTEQCMVGTAVANVAVDALLRKVAEGYWVRH